MAHPPRLHREGAMHAPHGEHVERNEELIAPRVEQIHPDTQPSHRARRAPPLGHEVRVEADEQRASERLPLEPFEHRGQQIEVWSVAGDRPIGLQHVTSQPTTDQALDGQRAQRHAGRSPAQGPRRDGRERRRADRRRAEPEAHPGWTRRRCRQRREGIGARGRRDLLAEDRQVLAQVQVRRQGLHRRLPGAHRCGIRRRQQPRGDRLLAHAGPRVAEQLVQRAFAEEVETVGVRVAGIAEAISGAAGPRPLASETREPSSVERRAPLRLPAPPANPPVDHHQGRERQGRRREPPRRQHGRPEREPCDQRRRQRDAEAGARDPFLEPAGVGRALLVQ